MLISHRHRFLYFVVPKSASATLRKSLAPFADVGWPVSLGVQHQTVRDFLASEHGELFDRYFRFTFVRNPYDRMYSGYMQDRHAAASSPRWAREKQPIFDAIGDDFPRYVREHVHSADVIGDWRWVCFCPMSEFACRDGQPSMDFVGRAETFEDDLFELGRRLSIPLSKSDDVNVRRGLCSPALKYRDQFDRDTVRIANELYRDDFALFGYDMLDPEDFPDVLAPAS